MDNSVIIKGGKSGIIVVLDKEMEFDALLANVKDKFESSAKFFSNANMAISFEGRRLNDIEEKRILDVIAEVSDLNIVCLLKENNEFDRVCEDAVKRALESVELPEKQLPCQFYKGTLRSGQEFISDSSVIVLGDINPGAKVVAKGNVVVLGSLKGNIFAGVDGNENAFVVALDMNPMQIKIGDVIARSADTSIKIGKAAKNKNVVKVLEPKIAYVYEDSIYIEDLDQEVLNDITIE